MLSAASYYVSPSGNDLAAGTFAAPWRTINASEDKLSPGDTLYVRGGTYRETVSINISGTSTAPITVAAYPGETPVVDGDGVRPTLDWVALVTLWGDYVHLAGFEVRNTSAHQAKGVELMGRYGRVSRCYVHHTHQNGILIRGDGGIVEDSEVWEACRVNVNHTSTTGWASGLSSARDPVNGITDNAIIRRNVVHHVWGEGLSVYESSGALVEDNIVYDNGATNIYISDADNVVFQRNLVYNSSNESLGQATLSLADEVPEVPRSYGNVVINNLFYNGDVSLFWWTEVSGSGLDRVIFANNTLVDGELQTGTLNSASIVKNNIFLRKDGGSLANVSPAAGIDFSHNLWSSAPPSAAGGAGDVVGDPGLALTGSRAAGGLTSGFFVVTTSTSPVVDGGTPLGAVNEDFFRQARGASPDIGAHEWMVASTPARPRGLRLIRVEH